MSGIELTESIRRDCVPKSKVDVKGRACELVMDGSTDYRILLPSSPAPAERYAAEELKKYINLISSVDLEIVNDSVEQVLGQKFISIGTTSLFQDSRIDVSNLNLDGFRIKTFGYTLIIKGQRDRGTLYGVYDFLERFAGVRFLSPSKEFVPQAKILYLYECDITQVPDFALRSHFREEVKNDLAYAAKMRMICPNQAKGSETLKYGGMFFDDFSSDFHSYKQFLPFGIYKDSHPEWFTRDQERCQLVLSNGLNDDGTIDRNMSESVVLEMIKNIKKYLLQNPSVSYVFLGQNDNCEISQNANCLRQYKLFGGHAGQMIVFTNAIAKEIDEWLIEEGIDRKLRYGFFAYQYSFEPPIAEEKNRDGNSVFRPVNELVVPRHNVYVMLAPIEASYNETIKTERRDSPNYKFYECFKKWAALTNRFMIFDYNINYSDYLSWFPCFEAISNLQLYKEYGVSVVIAEGSGMNPSGFYQAELLSWIFGKLMWNVREDPDALIHEFNKYYFGKKAGKIMDDFVHSMNAHFKEKASENGERKPAYIYTYMSSWLVSPNTLNHTFLSASEKLIKEAEETIKNDSSLTAAQKELYSDSIMRAAVQVKYMRYRNFDYLALKNGLFGSEETTKIEKLKCAQELSADMRKIGMRYFGEGHDRYIDRIVQLATEYINTNDFA